MKERYIKLQIETIVNTILYNKKIIEKTTYEKVSEKIDKLLRVEKEKIE